MKKAYLKPEIDVRLYMVESTLLSSTNTKVIISGGGFNPIEGYITEVGEGEEGEPSGAKGGDFFEESVSTSSIWGDED